MNITRIEDCLSVIRRDGAWRWIVSTFLTDGPRCPICGSPVTSDRSVASFFELKKTWCGKCEKSFTPTINTPIHETSWKPEEFLKFQILTLAGRSPTEIAKHLGKSRAAVRDMAAKVELLQAASAMDSKVPIA
jgi:hypothetical protein